MKSRSLALIISRAGLVLAAISGASEEICESVQHPVPQYHYFGDLLQPPKDGLKRKGSPAPDAHRPSTSDGAASGTRRLAVQQRSPSKSSSHSMDSPRTISASSVNLGHRTPAGKGKEPWRPESGAQDQTATSNSNTPLTQGPPPLVPHTRLPTGAQPAQDGQSVPMDGRAAMPSDSVLEQRQEAPVTGISALQQPYFYRKLPPMLDLFVRKCNSRLDELKLTCLRSLNVDLNLPVGIYTLRGASRNMLMIRVHDALTPVPVHLNALKHLLRQLLCWTYYCQKVWIDRLKITRDGDVLQRKLLLWLEAQVFSPPEGLPAVGLAPSEASFNRGFGPIQQTLINYLASPTPAQIAPGLAVFLLGSWLKHARSDLWEWANFHQFQLWLESKIIKSHSKPPFEQSQFLYDEPNKLINAEDDLELRQKWDVLHKKIPINRPSHSLTTLDESVVRRTIVKIGQGIQKMPPSKYLERYITRAKAIFRSAMRNRGTYEDLTDIPLRKYLQLGPENDPKIWMIRVIGPEKQLVIPQLLDRRFLMVLKHVHFCHSALLLAMGREQEIEIHQGALLDWLYAEIFSPIHSLPVVGKAKEEPNCARFGPVQILIANRFSLKDSEDSFADAVYILGIWYKNMLPDTWITLGNDDQIFSNYMVRAIAGFYGAHPAERQIYEKVYSPRIHHPSRLLAVQT